MVDTVDKARQLRRDQTEAEKQLWYKLRDRQLLNTKFRRQHPLPPYILDFYCEELMLAIELDGGQHDDPKQQDHDKERARFLKENGIKVIRFWNNEIMSNMTGVLETILQHIPSPSPLSRGPSLSRGERVSEPQAKTGEGKKRILIGEIATVHGIKGLVKIRVYAENLDLFDKPVFISDSGTQTLKVTLKNAMKDYFLAEVEGITERTAAEKLRGTRLYVDRDTLPEPGEGEYYHVDLIGLTCIDRDGAVIGTIAGVDNFGAGDLLDIKPPQGENFYLPFTDETVLDIGGAVTIAIPEGLLE